MDEDNLCEFSSNSSFSGMNSLYEGFSIVIFSRAHCTRSELLHIHRSHDYRIIIRPDILFYGMKERYTVGQGQDLWQKQMTLIKQQHYHTMPQAVTMEDQLVKQSLHCTDKIQYYFYCQREDSPKEGKHNSRSRQEDGTSRYRLVNLICSKLDKRNIISVYPLCQ